MTNILELLKNEKVEWKKLGDVCEFKRGNTITKKNAVEGDVPVIAGGQKPAYYHNVSNRKGITITVAGSGAYAGYVSYWNQPIFLSDAFSIEANNDLNKRYLYYWLLDNQHKIYELKKGSGVPHVYGKDLANLEIPIPLLETQGKIVEILDKFTNYVSELQSELQSRTKQYEYYRDMLLSEEYLNKVTKEMEEDRRVRIEKLNDICDLKRGKRLVKSELQEEGEFPVYQNSIIPLGYYYESNFDSDKTFIISAGSAGEIIYSDREFWAADDVYVLMTKENISSKFLYYSLLSKQHVIKSKVRKASVPRLSKEDIEKLFIPLPSLSLQNKIVKILDKFQVILADTKGLLPEEIAQRQKQYEYYREKLLTFEIDCDKTHERTLIISNDYYDLLEKVSRLVGITFEVKARVEEKPLGEIVTIVLGGTPNKNVREYWDNGSIPWMSSGEVNKRNIYITDNYITEKGYRNSSATLVPKNSTVIALAGQGKTRGMVARIKIELSTNQSLATLVPKEKIINDYLFYFLNAQYLKLRSISSGDGSRGGLNKEILSKFLILLPPLHVQQHIVSILDKFYTLVHDITEGLPKEIELRQKQYEYWREQLLSFNR